MKWKLAHGYPTMLQQKLLNKTENEPNKALQQAFSSFNQASDCLSAIYQNLERQVSLLSSELATARNQQAQQYEEKERIAKRLQNLLKVLPAGIIVLDDNGLITEHNPAALALLGEPLQGESWRAIVAREFRPRWDDGHDITTKDGRCVNISTQSLEQESAQIILIKDVTETRQLQQQLDRLKRLSDMGDMASSLAHQIRTPLSAALLYASNLQQPNLDAEQQKRFVTKLQGRLQHLESLVEDMLLFARGGKFDSEHMAFTKVLQEFADSVEPQLEQTGAKLVMTNSVEAAVVDVNRHAITSALQNLLNNAIQASEKPVVIHISVAQSDKGRLALAFSDNGPGIEADIKEKIFEPFFTTHSQGNGLGLCVVEAVIRAHGGEISLAPVEGEGTCFSIQLPLVHDTDPVQRAARGKM